MGFDYKKIKILNSILNQKDLYKIDIDKIKPISNENYKELFKNKNKSKYFNFESPTGWKGFIEIC